MNVKIKWILPLIWAAFFMPCYGASRIIPKDIRSFNSGEFSPLMNARSNFPKYDSGAKTLTNMLTRAQGPIARRPGTKYIASTPGPYPRLICDYTSPTIPTEPTDTALSGETEITDKTGLAAISGAGHYALMNDIDAAGAWTPLRNFSGVLEGNGYTISNLTVSAAGTDKQGMFGWVAANAEIRNLVLKEFSISGASYVGGLIGDVNNVSDVVIKNVRIENSTITAAGSAVGGLIGMADDVNDLRIFRCIGFQNTITVAAGYAGGLFGYLNQKVNVAGTIEIANCSNWGGNVIMANDVAGGLIGHFEGQLETNRSTLHTCSSTADISITADDGFCGGLIGSIHRANVSDCWASGDIEDEDEDEESVGIGGLVGFIEDESDFVNCYSTGDITLHGSDNHVGGLIGKFDTGFSDVIHCYTTSNINLYNANASSPDTGEVGGFTGSSANLTYPDPCNGNIELSWCSGDIWIEEDWKIKSGVGGFIGQGGYTYSIDINNCYTTTDIAISVNDNSVEGPVGGFAGEFLTNATADWYIEDCYASGVLPADSNFATSQLGGFLGLDSSSSYDVNCTNCYWDIEVSGVTDDYSDGAVGLDSASMQTQTTFTDAGWDYSSVWVQDAGQKRVIPYEYSTEYAYIIEMGHKYMRFFRNSAQITSGGMPYQIPTPFDEDDLFELQFVQDANSLYMVQGNYIPQVLSRSAHATWTMAELDYQRGPFLDENDTIVTITPSSRNGRIMLTASAATFDDDHLYCLWQIKHSVAAETVSGSFTATGNSAVLEVQLGRRVNWTTHNKWTGVAILQRSHDSGATWKDVQPCSSGNDNNILYPDIEDEDDALYRVRMDSYTIGTCDYTLTALSFDVKGVVKITNVLSSTSVVGDVQAVLGATTATTEWSEAAWSTLRGWPQTIDIHEQRMIFGGSRTYPQAVWASVTAETESDYGYFLEGANDDDAWTYILPGFNPIRWMRSHTYLMMGTSGGLGMLGMENEALTPTAVEYRNQTNYGSAYIQAPLADNAVLYIERGGQKLREVLYSFQNDTFLSADMTILSEHITGDGIDEIDFQKKPDPILWCIRDDGVLPTFTYERKHDILSWAKHTTGASGEFESVAVIPGGASHQDEDEVWFVVQRTIDSNEVKYIEQLQPFDWGTDQNDCWFVDCGGTDPNDLAWLEGETVALYGDGRPIGTYTVSSGAITPEDANDVYTDYVIGIPYTSVYESMPMVINMGGVSSAAKKSRVRDVVIDFYETLGCHIGTDSTHISDIKFSDDSFATQLTLVSGLTPVIFPRGYSRSPVLYIQEADPIPLTIRGLYPSIEVTME